MELKAILEAALFAAQQPVTMSQLQGLFEAAEQPEPETLQATLVELAEDYSHRPLELILVAGGWRFQVRAEYSPWVSRLFEEKPGRYSRAVLETLAIIAYRQPVTRGEIEQIRGVAVSQSVIRTLLDREWVQVVGHKEVPGRPGLYATTRHFLDYFNLQSLEQLPTLQEIADLDSVAVPDAVQTPLDPNDETPETTPITPSEPPGGAAPQSAEADAATVRATPADG
ncbi:MAG: SMC-Scp complex subunit ScpB [Methylococcaceae bacterium]|nr:MAG: SMC-Scp complex subunit ScpB [Methylococcaceae bacterium]